MFEFNLNRGRLKSARVHRLPITSVAPNPAQPRRQFDAQALADLTQSIVQHGLLQPITVRKVESGYELIAGERRLRAAKAAGLTHIPAIVMQVDLRQSAELALVENLLRSDLSFFEEAEAIRRLIGAAGLTQQQVADRLSMRQATVANKLRLLRIGPQARALIEQFALTERHARAILRLSDEAQQCKALQHIAHGKLNVAQSERYIEQLLQTPKAAPKRVMLLTDVRVFVNTINHAVEVMKSAGLQADSQQSETEEHIEFRIRIPKQAAFAPKEKKLKQA